MDPSSAQHQEMASQSSSSLESMLVSPKAQAERKPRPQPETALKCPRCDSTNTKFCYYNNYSLTQPRYFCKSCRRYWTKGGTLRNVPVGGGCRKNKRSSSSSSSSSSNCIKRLQEQHQPLHLGADRFPTNPLSAFSSSLGYDHSHDLSAAFAGLHNKLIPAGFNEPCDLSMFVNPSAVSGGQTGGGVGSDAGYLGAPGFLNAVRGGFLDVQPGVFQDLYYGGEMESVEGGGEDIALPPYEEMSKATTTSVTVTAMKQEVCSDAARQGGVDPSKAMWGNPWQNVIGGDGSNMTGGELDAAGRECWGGLTQSWHGLLNSPLM